MSSGSSVSEVDQLAAWGNIHHLLTMEAAWPSQGRVLTDMSLVIIFRPV